MCPLHDCLNLNPCLLVCLFPSSLLRVGDHFMYQRSPLLPVSHQPWTLCHCSVLPVLDIVRLSAFRYALFSLTLSLTPSELFGHHIVTSLLKILSLLFWEFSQGEFHTVFFVVGVISIHLPLPYYVTLDAVTQSAPYNSTALRCVLTTKWLTIVIGMVT